MRYDALLCILVMLGEFAGAAQADPAAPQPPPRFSKSDSAVIGRNELLRAIVDKDPWLVRRILDAMERMHGAAGGLDPAKDPDLATASRTAEGSVEWFELLKRALDEKEGRAKPAAVGRSAEGSVEMIDMMKRVKSEKDKGK